MLLETSHLQTLLAVAKNGSFSKAAEELHVTQSAISQNIKSIENKLKVKLIQRTSKGVQLTEEGHKIYGLARDFINRIDSVVHSIQEEKELMKGSVRIGTLMGIGKSWLTSRLLDFTQEYPEVIFQAKYANPEELIDLFENNELDCLIISEQHLPSLGEKVHVFNEFLTLVAPKNQEFEELKELNMDILLKFPIILYDKSDALFYRWCREKLGTIPKKINRRLVINSHGAMIQAVAKGMGVAVLPSHVIKRSYYKDKVLNLGSHFEVFNQKYFYVFHSELDALKRFKVLSDFLSKEGPLEFIDHEN
jgi:DNA-binding transcriptional LysR family regulator